MVGGWWVIADWSLEVGIWMLREAALMRSVMCCDLPFLSSSIEERIEVRSRISEPRTPTLLKT
jgi:hypothetical protein